MHEQQRQSTPTGKRTGYRLIPLLLLVVAGLTAGTIVTHRHLYQQPQAPDVLTVEVKQGPFLHEIVEQGEIDSSRNVEVLCEVKSRNGLGTAIIDVIPEGSQVRKGDVLLHLDTSGLELQRLQQEVALNTTKAALVGAQNAFATSQIARQEFLEGTYLQEEQLAKNEVTLAEENLRRSQQYAKHSELLASRGYVTALQLEGDRFAVEKSEGILSAAITKLKVLQEYRRAKALKSFDSEIRSWEAQVKSAEIRYNLELDELRNIERQLANCTIVAPQDGQLVYANVNNGGSNNFIVEPGAMVRERQVIFRLPDPAHMQVDANIHESRITLVSAGMPVTIHLDAFPELKLKGSVAKVNEYPEPTTWFGSQVKKYGATVTIENPPPDLRKGLTAEVRIEIGSRDAAVQVPLQAIHDHGDRHYCFVKRNGMWSAREVEVGAANDQYAAIGSGLAVDEVVAMNPKPLLEFVSLPESDSSDKDESSALALQKASSPSATTPAGESDSNAKQKPDDRSSAKPADTARNDMLLKKPVSMLLTRDNSK